MRSVALLCLGKQVSKTAIAEKQLEPNLDARIKPSCFANGRKVDKVEGDIHFKDGNYKKTALRPSQNGTSFCSWKMERLHKATTNSLRYTFELRWRTKNAQRHRQLLCHE
jgi:hypothetical protein